MPNFLSMAHYPCYPLLLLFSGITDVTESHRNHFHHIRPSRGGRGFRFRESFFPGGEIEGRSIDLFSGLPFFFFLNPFSLFFFFFPFIFFSFFFIFISFPNRRDAHRGETEPGEKLLNKWQRSRLKQKAQTSKGRKWKRERNTNYE